MEDRRVSIGQLSIYHRYFALGAGIEQAKRPERMKWRRKLFFTAKIENTIYADETRQ
jgi:hypothetical protein